MHKPEILDGGSKVWKVNGNIHREDGPAFIFYDGDYDDSKSWWLNNRAYFQIDWFNILLKDKLK